MVAIKSFKPMLFANESISAEDIVYPQLCSYKLDGIRCIVHPEHGLMTRSLKPIVNKQLQDKFQPLVDIAQKNHIILDGEIYSHIRSFQEITRAVMTQDLYDAKTLAKIEKEGYSNPAEYSRILVENMQFWCFDCVYYNDDGPDTPFHNRLTLIKSVSDLISTDVFVPCKQVIVKSAEDTQKIYELGLKYNYEGVIIKNPSGRYKFGRTTLKENLGYKFKPYIEKSAIIKGVVQATEVRDGVESTINELGYSVTSKKKDDRVLIDKASAFLVDWEGRDLKVTIAATDAEKEQIWADRDMFIGCELLFKAMDVGAKDLPRHPVSVRWWLKNE